MLLHEKKYKISNTSSLQVPFNGLVYNKYNFTQFLGKVNHSKRNLLHFSGMETHTQSLILDFPASKIEKIRFVTLCSFYFKRKDKLQKSVLSILAISPTINLIMAIILNCLWHFWITFYISQALHSHTHTLLYFWFPILAYISNHFNFEFNLKWF